MEVEVSAPGSDTDTLLTHPTNRDLAAWLTGGLRLHVQKAYGQVGPWEARGSGLGLPSSLTRMALRPVLLVLVPKTGSHSSYSSLGSGVQTCAGQSRLKTPQKTHPRLWHIQNEFTPREGSRSPTCSSFLWLTARSCPWGTAARRAI